MDDDDDDDDDDDELELEGAAAFVDVEGATGFLNDVTGVGATGCLFLRIPVGFLSDKGMILSLSSFGAFGAEAPSKKSAGNEGEEEEVEETEEEEDDTEEERDPFSCFLFWGPRPLGTTA